MQNKDDQCLRWALPKNPQRPTKYPTEDGLDFTGIATSTTISQISKMEKQSKLAVDVFGLDKGLIVYIQAQQTARGRQPN